MQLCEFHPTRVAVGRCHKCGRRFCVECAEETGQTRLCKHCMPEPIKKDEVAQAVQTVVPQAPGRTASDTIIDKKEDKTGEGAAPRIWATLPEAPLPPEKPDSDFIVEKVEKTEKVEKEEKKKKKEKGAWKDKIARDVRKADDGPQSMAEEVEAHARDVLSEEVEEAEDLFIQVPELPEIAPVEVEQAEEKATQVAETPAEDPAPAKEATPPSPVSAPAAYNDEDEAEAFFATISLNPSAPPAEIERVEEGVAPVAEPHVEEVPARQETPAEEPAPAREAAPPVPTSAQPVRDEDVEGKEAEDFFDVIPESAPTPMGEAGLKEEAAPPAEEATAKEEPAAEEPAVTPSEREKAAETPAAGKEDEAESFLALAPDYDFSELEQEERKPIVLPRPAARSAEKKTLLPKWRKPRREAAILAEIEEEASVETMAEVPVEKAVEAVPDASETSPVEAPVVIPEEKPADSVPAPVFEPKPEPAPAEPAPASLDLDDVLATLVDTTAVVPAPRARGAFTALEEAGEAEEALPSKKKAKVRREALKARRDEIKEQKREEKKQNRVERAERWDFLSQPRANDDTYIATTRPRAVLVVFFAWLMTAALWAVPNAFLPFWPFAGDRESLLWALVVGSCTGLFFWRIAGRKHSTKLAVQALLVTLFGIMGGEFLHWSLIIIKENAFRTVFFDIISFKFIWEYGGQILGDMARAMFPAMFLLLLLMPAAVAFVIGYGMPPVPEILFEMGWALRGRSRPEKGTA